MPTLSHTFSYVLDQDEALEFYVGKLGMVVHTDADLGVMRFLTVNFADQPDVELVLMVPGPPSTMTPPPSRSVSS
jgi:catechol 2,3-dioxygenase-like lactoylglutathione lyase family enzyme